MLDIEILRNEPERVRKAIEAKNGDPAILDKFLALDKEWRADTTAVEQKRAEQKKLSAERKIEEAKKLKEEIKQLEERISAAEAARLALWKSIPNLPSADTPAGKSDEDNQVIKVWGVPPEFDFDPKDHLALGEGLGIIDTETAGQVSGTRFGYLKGDAVILEFALIQHAFHSLTNPAILKGIAEKVRPGYSAKPFTPVLPPVMIRPEVMDKMARLEPREERYHIPGDDLYLIGSAEHTMGPMHMDQIIPADRFPIRYLGFSTSFRREACASGKDTRGILRVHQFDKVEMESFTMPEDSEAEQDFLVAIEEYLMQSLELPYRLVMCCTGDQGDPDARHIDLETWMPGEGKYRETHSADLMTDYQARRLNTRLRRADGRLEFVHMNDATAIAGRTLIAIIENCQTKEGRIKIPAVLQPYVGKDLISPADLG